MKKDEKLAENQKILQSGRTRTPGLCRLGYRYFATVYLLNQLREVSR